MSSYPVSEREAALMSFQAYINNIKTKTGKTPDDFKILAKHEDLLQRDGSFCWAVNGQKND